MAKREKTVADIAHALPEGAPLPHDHGNGRSADEHPAIESEGDLERVTSSKKPAADSQLGEAERAGIKRSGRGDA